MTKLNKKLFIRFSLVLFMVVMLSFVLNTYFLPKYVLYQKKNHLGAITSKIEAMDKGTVLSHIPRLENEYHVTIVDAKLNEQLNELNYIVKEKLNRKGITLSKFWITEESLGHIQNSKVVKILYSQEKLKSSFLVTFIKKDDLLIVVGESISYSTETLNIVNQFNLYISLCALLIMLLLTTLLARRIVRPLAKLQEAAEDISNLSFKQVQIQTGDEIELLAHSINRMSTKLEQSHLALEEKNRNLRTFIADISHELKTPLSLIKAYAAGIKDGLDDGTYVDVIERQADEITNLVDKLLELSRLQTDTYTMSAWDFQSLFHTTLEKYRIALQQQSIVVEVNEVGLVNTYVWADRQKIEIVLNNLIMNAIKYTTDHRIQITLEHVDRSLLVTITNGMEVREDMNWDNLWEPFYVLESSRNKQLSGTGLGLSIVRAIMIKHDSRSTVHVHNREITFQISITLYGDSL